MKLWSDTLCAHWWTHPWTRCSLASVEPVIARSAVKIMSFFFFLLLQSFQHHPAHSAGTQMEVDHHHATDCCYLLSLWLPYQPVIEGWGTEMWVWDAFLLHWGVAGETSWQLILHLQWLCNPWSHHWWQWSEQRNDTRICDVVELGEFTIKPQHNKSGQNWSMKKIQIAEQVHILNNFSLYLFIIISTMLTYWLLKISIYFWGETIIE